jgi:signal peptide peptidase SppA
VTKTNYLPHLASRVFGVPLMIQPDKLTVILQAIGPRLGLREAEVEIDVAGATVVARTPKDNYYAEELDEEARNQKPCLVTPDGIAVLAISGTLVKKASWLDAYSGLSSYESIRAEFSDAMGDPRIRGILLDIDSPGGEVGGLYDLADAIHAGRQEKPVFALADDDAFSAAYAIASSAERIFVTRTGGVGSIGVIALHVDQSAFDEKVGRKYTAIYAGKRKNDFSSHEPLTDGARATLQAEIDRLYDLFVDTVARNRGVDANAIRKTDAGLYYAERALSAGLADQVGTFDDAHAALLEAVAARKKARVAASAATQIPQMEAGMNQPDKTADASETRQVAAEPNAEQKRTEEQKPAEQAPATEQKKDAPAQAGVDAAALEARLRAEYEEIATLCTLAGKPGFVSEAIARKMTVAQVRDALLAAKADEARANAVNSQTSGAQANAEAQLTAAANQIASQRNIPFAQAYVQALNQNPALYRQYLAEKSAVQPAH